MSGNFQYTDVLKYQLGDMRGCNSTLYKAIGFTLRDAKMIMTILEINLFISLQERAVEIKSEVIVIDSDDDNNIQYQR